MKALFSWLWPWRVQSSRVGSDATTSSMSTGRSSFETSFDDNRSSQVVDIGSQGHLQHCGNRKQQLLNTMPGLLRLNSIGEDACINHPLENCVKSVRQERAGNTTGLSFASGTPNWKSYAEALLSSRTKQPFRNMSTVKAFSSSGSSSFSGQSAYAPIFKKSFSFSESMAKPNTQANYLTNNSESMRKPNLSKSFNSRNYFSRGRVDFPANMPGNGMSWRSCSMDGHCAQFFGVDGGNVTIPESKGTQDAYGTTQDAYGTTSCGNRNFSIKSAVDKILPLLKPVGLTSDSATCGCSSSTQPQSRSMCAMPAQFQQDLDLERRDSISCSSEKSPKSQIMQAVKEAHCDTSAVEMQHSTSTSHAVSMTPLASSMTPDPKDIDPSVSDSSIEEIRQSVNTSLESDASINNPKTNDENTPSMDSMNRFDQHKKSKEVSKCPLKHIVSVSSVLFSPRKTVKKGRPSSKRQKKRQREKRKHTTQPIPANANVADTSSLAECKTDQHHEASESETDSFNATTDMPHSHPKQSTPVKAQSKHPTIACFLITSADSDPEETDGDFDNEDSDWSADEGACISPIKGAGFNVALNLDSIFKKKNIPSLRTVLNAEESGSDSESLSSSQSTKNGLCLTLSLSLSEDESHEDSVEFNASPCTSAYSEKSLFGFAPSLSFDTLFSKRPSFKAKKSARLKSPTVDIDQVDSSYCDESLGQSSFDHGGELPADDMNEINARWDRGYPTAGFRTCCSASSDIVEGPNIKVRFAAEPHLFTVHEVGAEERGGTWHHFALDRERFERRIKEVGEILSPVLQQDHRAWISTRNLQLQQQMKH